MDLFAANGFHDGKPHTWVLDDGVSRRYPKKNPTMEDAYRFAMYKLKAMYIGADTAAVARLEEVNKKSASLYSKQRQALRQGQGAAEAEGLATLIERLKTEAVEKYAEYIMAISTGMEFDDLMKYDSKDVLKSVVERLENLNAVGIFKNQPPPFDEKAAIWRYDISSLSEDEMKMFVSFRVEQLFHAAKQRGAQDDLLDIIVLDEAHLFFSGDGDDNILNTLAREARKFGIGLICASQSPEHFSEDFLTNVGAKIILGLDAYFWKMAASKLNIERDMLSDITSRKSLALQLNNKGETRNDFRLVLLTPD